MEFESSKVERRISSIQPSTPKCIIDNYLELQKIQKELFRLLEDEYSRINKVARIEKLTKLYGSYSVYQR